MTLRITPGKVLCLMIVYPGFGFDLPIQHVSITPGKVRGFIYHGNTMGGPYRSTAQKESFRDPPPAGNRFTNL